MITFNDFTALKRWIYILLIIIAITLIIGVIFKISVNQLAGSIFITAILVISAVILQKLGLRYSDPNSKDGSP